MHYISESPQKYGSVNVCLCVPSPVQGIQMFEQGQYSQAVDMFTEAIYCDPKDHR